MTKGLKNSKALGEPYKLPLFPPLLPQNAFEHLFLRWKTKKKKKYDIIKSNGNVVLLS